MPSTAIEGVSERERHHHRNEDPPLRKTPATSSTGPTEPSRREVVQDRPSTLKHRAGVRFTHVGHAVDHAEFATFGDAVEAARDTIREIDGCPGHFTRTFIALRQRSNLSDRELVRWEVFRDRVELAKASS